MVGEGFEIPKRESLIVVGQRECESSLTNGSGPFQCRIYQEFYKRTSSMTVGTFLVDCRGNEERKGR